MPTNVSFQVMDFYLEEPGPRAECYDYVEIYEEPSGQSYQWCGSIPSGSTYVVDSQVTKAIFHADESINMRGFFIKYFGKLCYIVIRFP